MCGRGGSKVLSCYYCCIIKKIAAVNVTSNMIGHSTPNVSINSTVGYNVHKERQTT